MTDISDFHNRIGKQILIINFGEKKCDTQCDPSGYKLLSYLFKTLKKQNNNASTFGGPLLRLIYETE